MRIDRLRVKNFKKFTDQTFTFHPQFTLLVGENGSGKTSVLDALAVALGVWLVKPPDSTLLNSGRPIDASERRLEVVERGDRPLFQEAPGGVEVEATGRIDDHEDLTWVRRIAPDGKRSVVAGLKKALAVVQAAFARAQANESVLLPVIAYYGAGRAWMPHRERNKAATAPAGPARRWGAFYDCLNDRIRLVDLALWFQNEAIASVNRGGRRRPGFEAVRRAVLNCIPGADDLWYDGERAQLVLSVDRRPQPLSNLSAGQQTMLALVADVAIKAVTQNNHLVPPDVLGPEDHPLPRVLAETPGVVLVDELDVHLHPRWQRRIVSDLKRTFPKIQFVCTSHSPQIVGELPPDEIRLLDEPYSGRAPHQAYGLDSNAVLEELMQAESRAASAVASIAEVEASIDEGDLAAARENLAGLRSLQRGETRDTARLEATINTLETLAHEDG